MLDHKLNHELVELKSNSFCSLAVISSPIFSKHPSLFQQFNNHIICDQIFNYIAIFYHLQKMKNNTEWLCFNNNIINFSPLLAASTLFEMALCCLYGSLHINCKFICFLHFSSSCFRHVSSMDILAEKVSILQEHPM